MKCEKIKKLILTDYADGELPESIQRKVASHLEKCASCRELEETLKEKIIMPIKETEHVDPPEEVWSRIAERIESPVRESFSLNMREFLDSLLAVRKPALAVISFLIIVLVGGVFTRTYFIQRNMPDVYIEEQFSFLESLTNGNGDLENGNGMWTEDFFL